MRALRSFAAQFEAHKKVTKTILGSIMLCLSFGMVPRAIGDDPSSSSTASLPNLAPVPVDGPLTGLSSSSDASLSDTSTLSASTQLTQPLVGGLSSSSSTLSLDSIATQIDSATATVQNSVSASTTALSAIPNAQAEAAEIGRASCRERECQYV